MLLKKERFYGQNSYRYREKMANNNNTISFPWKSQKGVIL